MLATSRRSSVTPIHTPTPIAKTIHAMIKTSGLVRMRHSQSSVMVTG